jgi:hypothetical protein
VPFVQGTYYLLIGLWPLVALDSLPTASAAADHAWSLPAFGLVVAVVGLWLLTAGRKRNALAEISRLGILVALVVASVDVLLVIHGTAPLVYLADAVIQCAFVLWWVRALLPDNPEPVGALRVGLT